MPVSGGFLTAQPSHLLVAVHNSPAVHLVYQAQGWTTDHPDELTSCGERWAPELRTPLDANLCEACVEAEIAAGHVRRNDDD